MVYNDNNLQALILNSSKLKKGIRLGIGGYGEVLSAKYINFEVAVKVSFPQQKSEKNSLQHNELLKELAIINFHKHPLVPRFLGINNSENIELVFEKIDGSTLEEVIKLLHKNSSNETIMFKTSDFQNNMLLLNNFHNLHIIDNSNHDINDDSNCSNIIQINEESNFNDQNNLDFANQLSKVSDLNSEFPYVGKYKSFVKKGTFNEPFKKDLRNYSSLKTNESQVLNEYFSSISTLEKNNIMIIVNFIELSRTLTYLHGINLIHRDLKPTNIMLDKYGNCKLLDFGISKKASHTLTEADTGGTMNYMAPENFGKSSNCNNTSSLRAYVSTKVDIWAFGCILSQVYSGEKPWNNIQSNHLLFIKLCKVASFGEKFEIPNIIKENYKPIEKIIQQCCENDPKMRITSTLLMFYLQSALYYYLSKLKEKLGKLSLEALSMGSVLLPGKKSNIQSKNKIKIKKIFYYNF
jgi:serine/threonine protein kinase